MGTSTAHDLVSALSLQSQQLDAQSGEEDHRPREGVGVSLELSEPDEADAPRRDGDDGQHGEDGRQPEGGGDEDDAGKAMPGGRVHDERDQRLARAEDEDGEQDPGGDVGLFARRADVVVDVDVLGLVAVAVVVGCAVGVEVDVLVRLVFDRPMEAPDEVGETEGDEKPGRGVSPGRLGVFEPGDREPEPDAEKPEDDRAQHVAQSRKKRNEKGFRKRPVAGPAHDDKGEIMVGSDHRMGQAQSRGGAREDENFSGHMILQKNGGRQGTRTPGLSVANAALSQLS